MSYHMLLWVFIKQYQSHRVYKTRPTLISRVRDLQIDLEWLKWLSTLFNDFKWLKEIWLIKEVKVWQIDRTTNGRMDGWIDKAGCRVACTRLKIQLITQMISYQKIVYKSNLPLLNFLAFFLSSLNIMIFNLFNLTFLQH